MYSFYIGNKLKYILINNISYQRGGKTKRDIIFLTGKAAVGKSTLANKYIKKGYCILSFDEIIKNEVSKFFSHIEIKDLYKIYRSDINDSETLKLKAKFVKIVKKKIKQNKKIIAEGGIRDFKIIREIFGRDKDFKFYYLVPKSKEEYVKRIFKRFTDDPYNYGRLGHVRNYDKDGKALNDYKKNGIEGKVITDLLNRVGNEQYNAIDKQYNYYAEEFNVEKIEV